MTDSSALEDELNVPQDATLSVGTRAPHENNNNNNNNNNMTKDASRSWSLQTTTTMKNGNAHDQHDPPPVVVVIAVDPSSSLRASPRCLIVGRQASTADIHIAHKSISRKHALVYYSHHVVSSTTKSTTSTSTSSTMPSLVLQDLGSKYGVHVNGSRIEGSVVLQQGDKIVFGNVRNQEYTVHQQQQQEQHNNNNKNRGVTTTYGPQEQKNQKDVVGDLPPVPEDGITPLSMPHVESGLTGRAKREAEIAAMMESFDDAPTYQAFVPAPPVRPVVNAIPQQTQSVVQEEYSLPVTERLELSHTSTSNNNHFDDNDARRRVLTCLAVDRAGSRFVVGSTDTYLRMYDFAGMDQHRTGPFKTLQIEDGHVLVDACYSNTGDRLLVATGSVTPKVLDRDGNEIIKFVRGDMYVIDPVRTTGHTAPVTGVSWNPLERDIVATSSLDGSARIWNLNGKTQFHQLVCDKVYRGKSAKGQKVGVTSVAFHPGGRELAFGTACGSIQVWNATKVGARPELATYHAHGEGRAVQSLVYSVDGSKIASRSMIDDTVRVWDARRLSRSATPIVTCTGLPSVHENSNSSFRHDGHLICAGMSQFGDLSQGARKERGSLKFYTIPAKGSTASKATTENGGGLPILELQVASDAGVVHVVWHPKLNQVIVACSDGGVHIFYDPTHSSKGALLVSSRSGRPVDELSQLLASRAPKGYTAVTGDIVTPNALPMFRGEKEAKRKRSKDREDPAKSRKPEPPVRAGMKAGSQSGTAVNFAQFVSDSIVKTKNIAGKDPREELFRYSEGKTYVTQAYEGDERVLAKKTLEEEEEDKK